MPQKAFLFINFNFSQWTSFPICNSILLNLHWPSAGWILKEIIFRASFFPIKVASHSLSTSITNIAPSSLSFSLHWDIHSLILSTTYLDEEDLPSKIPVFLSFHKHCTTTIYNSFHNILHLLRKGSPEQPAINSWTEELAMKKPKKHW